jgi:hypothetical protein
MIELYSQLVVPVPSNATGICTPSGSTDTTYANWGYATVNSVILTGGQKYSIVPQSPGYIVFNLGYYSMGVTGYTSGSGVNFNHSGFNLNDYNTYANNSSVKSYYIDTSGFTSIATAYAYTDTNGFTLDLTNLQPQYAVILGLLKFDFVNQFTTYTLTQAGTTYTYYVYGMSTAQDNMYFPNGASNVQINTYTFLGIPVNTTVSQVFTNPAIGYRFNYNFLVNDETVSNSPWNFPTDESNVAGIPQNTSILIQSNGSYVSGASTLIQFGSPQNITYNTVVGLSSTNNIVTATGSNPASGLPNTNAIADLDITLPLPYLGGGGTTLKSIYNNNGYNDVWVISQNIHSCQPNSTTFYFYPPYFIPYNIYSNNYVLTLSSSNPDIIYQYIAQPPVVQVTTTTAQSITTSSSSTTPSTTAPTPSQTKTTTSTTSSTTVTNVTQQIVTALANPIVALILALALVGLAVFVLA